MRQTTSRGEPMVDFPPCAFSGSSAESEPSWPAEICQPPGMPVTVPKLYKTTSSQKKTHGIVTENISVLTACVTGTIFQITDTEIDVQQLQIVAFKFQNRT